MNDPRHNADLEGVGFINETTGWVGGWGRGFNPGPGDGITSGTTDGGATWFNANDVGAFLNQFRFTGSEPIVGYASGRTIYQCVAVPDNVQPSAALPRARPRMPAVPLAWKSMEIKAEVPRDARQFSVTIFNPRQTLVKVLTEETSPAPGARTLTWDFKTDEGKDAGIGHFTYRVSIDDKVMTEMVMRPARTSPEELGAQVIKMIELHAPIAMRSHDELVLPDANGKPVELKALFDTPRDLLAALIRGRLDHSRSVGPQHVPGRDHRDRSESRADEIGALASRGRPSVPVDRRRRRHTRRGDLITAAGAAARYRGVAAAVGR